MPNATQQTWSRDARIAAITSTFSAWGIELISVQQHMPLTAPRWFRVNLSNGSDMDAAKGVAEAIREQYGVTVVCVVW